ncbi:thioredoxin family protein [Pyxidicoccus fallax]|uniref:Thioredoxin family protein n=1 Tax=Pyxidicoccus fallax TaxID=394095 RepID=A0A848LAR9_9BACT|nr:thioredoxin family protein [Pyxidicoccus fallax]NMO15717.1 thioredoxin family protein [Pyxidicoccus fallax]NPC77124.1 thioredoxin family protein [Pyxidicoccus fallax]
MMELLVLGGAVLAVMVVLNLLLTFALVRRVRALQDRVSNVPARDPALPQPGDAVGAFQAATPEGGLLTDEALRSGVNLVGFFTTGCHPCATLRAQLLESPPRLPLMAFVEGHEDDPAARELGAALGAIARVAFITETDSVTKAFRPAGYPTLIRVENGTVAASGHQLRDVLS